MVPILVGTTAALGTGLGVLVSAVTIKYRDLQHLVTFGVQLLMYATPVIYPLSAVGPRYRDVLALNPMTPIVEAFRFAFLGAGTFSALGIVYSVAVAVGVLFWGAVVFNRVERTFLDSV